MNAAETAEKLPKRRRFTVLQKLILRLLREREENRGEHAPCPLSDICQAYCGLSALDSIPESSRDVLLRSLRPLEGHGLIIQQGHELRLTDIGRQTADDILQFARRSSSEDSPLFIKEQQEKEALEPPQSVDLSSFEPILARLRQAGCSEQRTIELLNRIDVNGPPEAVFDRAINLLISETFQEELNVPESTRQREALLNTQNP
jgi:hypothetical protein